MDVSELYSTSGELLQCAGIHDAWEQTDGIACTASVGNIPPGDVQAYYHHLPARWGHLYYYRYHTRVLHPVLPR